MDRLVTSHRDATRLSGAIGGSLGRPSGRGGLQSSQLGSTSRRLGGSSAFCTPEEWRVKRVELQTFVPRAL